MVLGGIYVVENGTQRAPRCRSSPTFPMLGAACSAASKALQDERRELLIFVTPRIIMGTPATSDL